MILSSVVKLVKREIDPKQFEEDFADEIDNYKNLSHRKGSKIPIQLLEDVDHNFSVEEIDYLKLLLRNSQIDMYTASYIADGILLSNTFDFSHEELTAKLEDLVVES